MTGPLRHDGGSFAGRVVLVTGGASGIGDATAIGLAERGAHVVILDRRAELLHASVARHPHLRGVVGDVSNDADVERAVGAAVGTFGRLDVVVNNAGSVAATSLTRFDLTAALALWATNVLGPTLLARAALTQLTRHRGTIVNVSSSLGHKPAPGASQYGATKAALEQLTRSWAVELAGRGIRVNAIAPGPTESRALEHGGFTPVEIERIKTAERSQIPLGRRGDPREVARWIIALADPAATRMTGQVIDIDGGFGLV